jgi:voltage-gated potassium channel
MQKRSIIPNTQADNREPQDAILDLDRPSGAIRRRLYTIIFEANTFGGRAFDLVLIWAILGSVSVTILETVPSLREGRHQTFLRVEWAFTLLFTVEYFFRLSCHARPFRYAFSFFGLVDFLSILPSYLSLLFPGSQALVAIRIFRTLRLFRVLKLVRYMKEARILLVALQGSRQKIIVFLMVVIGIVISMGALMYLVEGEANGFTSIPRGIYWAVVTLTTVGYGDMYPKTSLGQVIASVVMILGYSIIAVPTGIFSAEIAQASRRMGDTGPCLNCGKAGHEDDARYCRHCGANLQPVPR